MQENNNIDTKATELANNQFFEKVDLIPEQENEKKSGSTLAITAEKAEGTLNQELSSTKKSLETQTAKKTALISAIGNINESAMKAINAFDSGEISLEQLENELSSLNLGYNNKLNVSELTIDPDSHNRTNDYFLIEGQTEVWLKKTLKALIDGDYDLINELGDSNNRFASFIVNIFESNGNDTGIAYRIVNGEKQIIFGESRYRAVKWLVENGYSEFNGKPIQLKGDKIEVTTQGEKQTKKYTENFQHNIPCDVDRLIQLNQSYEALIKDFKEGIVPKSKGQKAEGYALSKLSLADKKRGMSSIRKDITLSSGLETLSKIIGRHTLYLNMSAIREIYKITGSNSAKLSIKGFSNKLKQHLDAFVIEGHFSYDDPSISDNDKKKTVTKEVLRFISSEITKSDFMVEEQNISDDHNTNAAFRKIASTNPALLEQMGDTPEQQSKNIQALLSSLNATDVNLNNSTNDSKNHTLNEHNATIEEPRKAKVRNIFTESFETTQGIKVTLHFDALQPNQMNLRNLVNMNTSALEDAVTDALKGMEDSSTASQAV